MIIPFYKDKNWVKIFTPIGGSHPMLYFTSQIKMTGETPEVRSVKRRREEKEEEK